MHVSNQPTNQPFGQPTSHACAMFMHVVQRTVVLLFQLFQLMCFFLSGLELSSDDYLHLHMS